MNKQTDEIIIQNQLTLMNDCFHCHQLNELCPDCLDAKEARDAVAANELVNESLDYIILGYGVRKRTIANGGTSTESNPMFDIQDEPSAHDWISNDTVTKVCPKTGDKTIRTELFEQSSWLVDRIFDIEESMTLSIHECICSVCHYTINKHAVCPNCN